MPNVDVTINGMKGGVPAGSTVLAAARLMGIDIPTLCDHPAVEPIGACRICLVEIEKQAVLQPACTFPVSRGMVVHTESPRVGESRRFVLQLLFSERNHFCMFCQMSGSCELQDLAYQYGLDHWEYDRAFPKLSVDASLKYFALDHNRCILCRLCVRVCDALVGNGTLGLKGRGTQTMICADANVPLGESSCVSCGNCLQVCPTGALMDRASAFMGATDEIERTKTTCTLCSVGCGAELITRENRVIRVEGDWDAEPNQGLLCEIGRFSLLHETRQRVRKPLIRGEKGLAEASWEQALARVAKPLRAAGDKTCVVVSGLASTEAARALVRGMPGEKTLMEGVLSGDGHSRLSVLDEADLYLVAKTDLTLNYQVAGFAIKRAAHHRGARVIVLDDTENGLEPWAFRKFAPEELGEAVAIAKNAQQPAIVYGPRGAALAAQLARPLPRANLVGFPSGANALGIASAGVSAGFAPNGASVYYVLAAESEQVSDALLDALSRAEFVAVQACFREPWEEVAHVILPSPTAHEKNGTVTNAEGRVGRVVAGVTSGLPSEVEVIERLSALLA